MTVIEPDPELVERIVRVFETPPAVTPPHIQALLDAVSGHGRDFAISLATLVPDSAELGRALDAIDDAVSQAHRAVLRYAPVDPPLAEQRDSLGRRRRTPRPVVEEARVDEAAAVAMRDGKSPALPEP